MSFELFIRCTEKEKAELTESLPATALKVIKTTRYLTTGNINTIFARAYNCSASHLIFIDAALVQTPGLWRVLERSIDDSPDKSLTIACNGLQQVYAVPNRSKKTRVWPSWLMVVPVDIFQKAYKNSIDFTTLEFGFLEMGLSMEQPARIAFGNLELFNPLHWAGDLVIRDAHRLSEDYSVVLQTKDELGQQVPPQFRIKTFYQNIVPKAGAEIRIKEPRLISIICPVFKPEFLRPLIQSVVDQTAANWELRLGVDGPGAVAEGEIQEIIDSFQDERIFYFIQENRGTGPTRQRLAEEIRGEFFLPMDDDDMLQPEAIETFTQVIREYPEARLIRARARTTGLTEAELPQRKRYLINDLPNDPWEVTQPFVISRDLFNEVGGYEWDPSLYNAGEDTFLFHKLDKLGVTVHLIPQILYLRRLSTKNLSLYFDDSAHEHLHNLQRMYWPNGWSMFAGELLPEREFSSPDAASEIPLTRSLTRFVNDSEVGDVITGCRYIDYQNFGAFSRTIIDVQCSIDGVPKYVTELGEQVIGETPMTKGVKRIEMRWARSIEELARSGEELAVVLCGISDTIINDSLRSAIKDVTQANAEVIIEDISDLSDEVRTEMTSLGVDFVDYVVAETVPQHEGENNVCVIANKRDFITAEGDFMLCGMPAGRKIRLGNIGDEDIREVHNAKILNYIRGDYEDTCRGCPFCPATNVGIAKSKTSEPIPQRDAGALSSLQQREEFESFEERLKVWASKDSDLGIRPSVSVEIPVFKGNWLVPCIESVLRQTSNEWKLYCVWDGGDILSKKMLEIVDALNHPRLKVYFTENQGIARARKFLSSLSTESYILPLDDDDMLAPDAVKRLVDKAQDSPWFGVIRARREYINEAGQRIDMDEWFPFERRHYQHGMVRDVHNHSQPYLISRNGYLRTTGWEGFDDFSQAGEDCDIYLKMEEQGSVELLDEVLYYYRINDHRHSHVLTNEGAYEMWRRLADKTIDRIGLRLRRMNDKPPYHYERISQGQIAHEDVHFIVFGNSDLKCPDSNVLHELGITPGAISIIDAKEGIADLNRTCSVSPYPVICLLDGCCSFSIETINVLLYSMWKEELDIASPSISAPAGGLLHFGMLTDQEQNDEITRDWTGHFLLITRAVMNACGGLDPGYSNVHIAAIDLLVNALQRKFSYASITQCDVELNRSQNNITVADVQRIRKRWEHIHLD